jgi:succinate dehydrogenase assembly factor 2
LRTLLLRRNRATQASSSSPVVVVGVVASTIETTTRRTYMGGAGEMKSRRDDARPDDAVAAREQALWDKARPRYDAIMERHVRLPPEEDDVVDVDADVAPDARRRKRLVYRSKQRGWLEVDLLLGTWASINVPSLNADELDEFEKFVNMETIDIYNVLTLRSDVPEEMGGGSCRGWQEVAGGEDSGLV